MLDIIIIMIILFGAIVGFKRGIIKQSVITVGMILVLILSFILKNPISSIKHQNFSSDWISAGAFLCLLRYKF